MQLSYSLVADAVGTQLLVDIVESNLVELVYGNRDVHYLVSLAYSLSQSCEYLAVIDFDADVYSKTGENGVDNLHQLNLVEERVRAYHVGVTLVELTVTALLRTVSTPYGLYLITLEWQLQLVTVHDDIPCERNSKVVAQSLLAKACGEAQRIALSQFLVAKLACEVS